MSKTSLTLLAAARIEDATLEAVDGGFFNRSSSSDVKYGPRNSAGGNFIAGNNNIISGRDTNVY